MPTLTRTQRVAVIVGGLAFGLVLAVEFIPIFEMVWDGGFPLTVNVTSPSGRPNSVTCEAFGDRHLAEQILAVQQPPEIMMRATVADPFDGQPLTVPVPSSGRRSLFGRELAPYQFQYLVVIAVMPDGRRVGALVDIPDGRVTRSITVTLPDP